MSDSESEAEIVKEEVKTDKGSENEDNKSLSKRKRKRKKKKSSKRKKSKKDKKRKHKKSKKSSQPKPKGSKKKRSRKKKTPLFRINDHAFVTKITNEERTKICGVNKRNCRILPFSNNPKIMDHKYYEEISKNITHDPNNFHINVDAFLDIVEAYTHSKFDCTSTALCVILSYVSNLVDVVKNECSQIIKPTHDFYDIVNILMKKDGMKYIGRSLKIYKMIERSTDEDTKFLFDVFERWSDSMVDSNVNIDGYSWEGVEIMNKVISKAASIIAFVSIIVILRNIYKSETYSKTVPIQLRTFVHDGDKELIGKARDEYRKLASISVTEGSMFKKRIQAKHIVGSIIASSYPIESLVTVSNPIAKYIGVGLLSKKENGGWTIDTSTEDWVQRSERLKIFGNNKRKGMLQMITGTEEEKKTSIMGNINTIIENEDEESDDDEESVDDQDPEKEGNLSRPIKRLKSPIQKGWLKRFAKDVFLSKNLMINGKVFSDIMRDERIKTSLKGTVSDLFQKTLTEDVIKMCDDISVMLIGSQYVLKRKPKIGIDTIFFLVNSNLLLDKVKMTISDSMKNSLEIHYTMKLMEAKIVNESDVGAPYESIKDYFTNSEKNPFPYLHKVLNPSGIIRRICRWETGFRKYLRADIYIYRIVCLIFFKHMESIVKNIAKSVVNKMEKGYVDKFNSGRYDNNMIRDIQMMLKDVKDVKEGEKLYDPTMYKNARRFYKSVLKYLTWMKVRKEDVVEFARNGMFSTSDYPYWKRYKTCFNKGKFIYDYINNELKAEQLSDVKKMFLVSRVMFNIKNDIWINIRGVTVKGFPPLEKPKLSKELLSLLGEGLERMIKENMVYYKGYDMIREGRFGMNSYNKRTSKKNDKKWISPKKYNKISAFLYSKHKEGATGKELVDMITNERYDLKKSYKDFDTTNVRFLPKEVRILLNNTYPRKFIYTLPVMNNLMYQATIDYIKNNDVDDNLFGIYKRSKVSMESNKLGDKESYLTGKGQFWKQEDVSEIEGKYFKVNIKMLARSILSNRMLN